MEDKNSFFETFCKARLITGNEMKEKFLKHLSVVEEVCLAFRLLVNKAVNFTEGYQFDKAGLGNYIINLSKSSGR